MNIDMTQVKRRRRLCLSLKRATIAVSLLFLPSKKTLILIEKHFLSLVPLLVVVWGDYVRFAAVLLRCSSLLESYMDIMNQQIIEGKKIHYARIQELAHEFSSRNGSIVCRDLLGLSTKTELSTSYQRTEEYYTKRPCVQLVGLSAAIIEEYIRLHS